MKLRVTKSVAVMASVLAFGSAATADVVYSNAGTYSGSYLALNSEFGDQISAYAGNTNNVVTDFAFDYFTSMAGTAGRTGILKFYDSTGPNNTPGNVLFTSPTFNLNAGYNGLTLSGLNVNVPTRGFIWTVSFSGLQVGDQAGLLIYQNPTIGTSENDYWVRNPDNSWALKQIAGGFPLANFKAVVTSVPEPSVFQLVGLAGAAALGLAGFRRSSK